MLAAAMCILDVLLNVGIQYIWGTGILTGSERVVLWLADPRSDLVYRREMLLHQVCSFPKFDVCSRWFMISLAFVSLVPWKLNPLPSLRVIHAIVPRFSCCLCKL